MSQLKSVSSLVIPDSIKPWLEMSARTGSLTLLTGPTGCGKTHYARWIHEQSSRADEPFVSVNLATLYDGTLEAELFGYERGAFTGADRRRTGKLEAANGGTVFLDEIGELPLSFQARLLDFIQFKTITPLGSNRTIKLDVRIIAATHRNLEQMVRERLFREDLFHRLRVVAIEVPSLNDRASEFGEIVHRMIDEISAETGRSIRRLSETVAQRLERHTWPGNYRELRNVLEFAILAAEGTQIETQDLPPWLPDADGALSEPPVLTWMPTQDGLSFEQAMLQFESEFLRRAWERHGGRLSATARGIQVNKTTLLRRLRTHGLTPKPVLVSSAGASRADRPLELLRTQKLPLRPGLGLSKPPGPLSLCSEESGPVT